MSVLYVPIILWTNHFAKIIIMIIPTTFAWKNWSGKSSSHDFQQLLFWPSGGTRRQRLHEFPKWSHGFCDSPAFVLPKFGLNFSQIKAAVLQNQPLPVGLPRILHICLCILLDYIVKKILNRISSRPNSFWLTLQRWGHRGWEGGWVVESLPEKRANFNPVSTSISDFQKEFRREICPVTWGGVRKAVAWRYTKFVCPPEPPFLWTDAAISPSYPQKCLFLWI